MASSRTVPKAVLRWIRAKRETAQRLRRRMKAVFNWAAVEGHYTGENPAGDAVTDALPQNVVRKAHHNALPHSEVRAALEHIRAVDMFPSPKLALEFAILTACRSGEVRGACWEEIDLDTATWTVPASRMKAGGETPCTVVPRRYGCLGQCYGHF